ncbi:MAG: SBBP repeat-containing protein [Armatimonadetes bacterium]|nr:SBBP repeat-containing protein [Armatimonadota bacterium]
MKRFLRISIAAAARGEMRVKTGFAHRLIGVAVCLLALATAGVGQVTEAWVALYGPTQNTDEAHALAVDVSGNVYVTGQSWLGGGNEVDYATIKYDSIGNRLWVARYSGMTGGGGGAHALAVDGAGNVYVAGGSEDPGTYYDYATIKYDSNGNQLWAARYSSPGYHGDDASALVLDSAGNVYVTGSSYGGPVEYVRDYATIKYDSNGNQLWVARYNGPGNFQDYAYALGVDAAGNVYVTGRSEGAGTGPDYTTIKYDSNGNQLWLRRYNGPGNASDAAYALAVDAAGNVHVTGLSYGGGTAEDYATIKYDSNGNQLWVARYNGPGDGNDYATGLALDAASNVYVTGNSGGAGTDEDYATIKYDSNGDQLWVARYNGPRNASDIAAALAVDVAGNAYVTGVSHGTGTAYPDYATIKYDSNGNQRWVARYDSGDDHANALAVDPAGNVYVTGTNGQDWATIKYVQATTVLPSSFSLFRGLLISGHRNSLIQSDNDRLVMRPGVVFSSQEPPIQLIVNATAPNATPSRLEFSVEAHCSVPNIAQRIALYNFDTQAYETLNTSTLTTSDSTVVVVVSGNPGRFVGPNLELRSRVAYKAQGPVFVYPWFARVDQVKWTLID